MNTTKMISAELNIRRFDKSDEPEVEKATTSFHPDASYTELKEKIRNVCGVSDADNKILKLRNSEFILIPYSMLVETHQNAQIYYVDVTNVCVSRVEGSNILREAHINSVHSKLSSMEHRIEQAEMLLPQLECSRQTHFEESVNSLLNKVSFLNRRFDEILPQQWRLKMPNTIA